MNRTTMLFGESGVGKTTQVGRFARYIHEKTGKPTRLITADPGGTDPIQHYIDAGIIQVLSIVGAKEPIGLLRKLSRGDWIFDGRLAPSPGDVLRGVGGYAIEGLTSNGELLLAGLRAKGISLSQDPNYTFVEREETFYGSNMSYFGFVQEECHDLVINFSRLPVERVLWTAHEAAGEDNQRKPIYGPDIPGRKAIGRAHKWFGDVLHFDAFTVRVGESVDPVTAEKGVPVSFGRMYFVRHPDPITGVFYSAKARVPAEMHGELLKRWPGGFLTPRIVGSEMQNGLDAFLAFEDDLAVEAAGRLGVKPPTPSG